jgi:chromosome partitioning protein
VLNPKGGVGKSTLTTNLAGYFAGTGRNVAIVDMDKQGSSTYWLSKRPAELPVIYGVFAAPEQAEIPDDFSITLPSEIDLVIVDTPAGIPKDDLYKFTAGSCNSRKGANSRLQAASEISKSSLDSRHRSYSG